jgi:hypothetical protein
MAEAPLGLDLTEDSGSLVTREFGCDIDESLWRVSTLTSAEMAMIEYAKRRACQLPFLAQPTPSAKARFVALIARSEGRS